MKWKEHVPRGEKLRSSFCRIKASSVLSSQRSQECLCEPHIYSQKMPSGNRTCHLHVGEESLLGTEPSSWEASTPRTSTSAHSLVSTTTNSNRDNQVAEKQTRSHHQDVKEHVKIHEAGRTQERKSSWNLISILRDPREGTLCYQKGQGMIVSRNNVRGKSQHRTKRAEE